jgi:hypothetical protein
MTTGLSEQKIIRSGGMDAHSRRSRRASLHVRQLLRRLSNGPQHREEEPPEIVLGRYLGLVRAEEWARLGLAQLNKIKVALEKVK